jgi:hypothetical protein
MRLIDILNNISQLENQLIESRGEVSEEFELTHLLTNQQLLEKVDNFKFFLDRILKIAEHYEEQEEQAKRIKNALNKKISNSKDYIKKIMLEKNITTLEGDSYAFHISPTKGKLVIIDEEKAKQKFPKVKVDINTEELKASLVNNSECDFAKIEQTYSLRTLAKRTK